MELRRRGPANTFQYEPFALKMFQGQFLGSQSYQNAFGPAFQMMSQNPTEMQVTFSHDLTCLESRGSSHGSRDSKSLADRIA